MELSTNVAHTQRAAAAVTIIFFFCFYSRLLFVKNERQIKIIKTLTVHSTQSVRVQRVHNK